VDGRDVLQQFLVHVIASERRNNGTDGDRCSLLVEFVVVFPGFTLLRLVGGNRGGASF
jgi:hypothetical protein